MKPGMLQWQTVMEEPAGEAQQGFSRPAWARGEVLWLAGGDVQPSGHVTEQPECGGPQGNFPYPDFFACVHYCQQIFWSWQGFQMFSRLRCKCDGPSRYAGLVGLYSLYSKCVHTRRNPSYEISVQSSHFPQVCFFSTSWSSVLSWKARNKHLHSRVSFWPWGYSPSLSSDPPALFLAESCGKHRSLYFS